MTPVVSVILPVFNAGPFLREAVESLLAQTREDFEILACDDASSDESLAVLRSFSDQRIRVLNNEDRLGPAATRNRCCALSRGEYLAFFDADDVAMPTRLERQCAYLEQHPEIVLLGSWVQPIDANGAPLQPQGRIRVSPEEIPARMVFKNVFDTPTVIMRRRCWELERFDPSLTVASDYDHWLRLLALGGAAITQDELGKYRVHGSSLTFRERPHAEDCLRRIQRAHLVRLGIVVSDEELSVHRDLARGQFTSTRAFVEAAEAWLLKLSTAVDASLRPQMQRVVGDYWYSVCFCCAPVGPWLWQRYRRSPLSTYFRWPLSKKAALLWSTIRAKKEAGRV